MFMGEFTCKVDNKGRMMLPSKFRDELGEQEFVITRGLDNCIDLFPIEEWKNIEDKLKKLQTTNSKHRAYQRFVMSAATKTEFDNQGRLNIPTSLMEHAQIDKKIIVTGMNDKIEIWSEELWKKYIQNTGESIEDLVDEMNFDF
ncbi:MAG: division/cell wall cluster transcriptional repressor MraZ [Leptotrichiaceae bacterium]|nr:division/cell wall cluster transcriptional repressor MraZ [Leptotrichiaceae bacterium]MBP7025866.1 division/cell wall cluster transcriptional repressor MraZ [Leptotrichiaceae bacterium]MBP9538598.1 division/cell wall cluster transcriptional repressor MraZ [Leptotrichiaceae bacterium]